MERQTKFRAWDKQDKRMIVHEQDFIPIKVTSMGVLRLNPNHEESFWEFMPTDRFEFMQFIGLHDRKGKEIYEGDIIKTEGYTGVVRYEHQGAQYHIAWKTKNSSRYMPFNVTFSDGETWQCDYMEVIGNIFDNPELLKQ